MRQDVGDRQLRPMGGWPGDGPVRWFGGGLGTAPHFSRLPESMPLLTSQQRGILQIPPYGVRGRDLSQIAFEPERVEGCQVGPDGDANLPRFDPSQGELSDAGPFGSEPPRQPTPLPGQADPGTQVGQELQGLRRQVGDGPCHGVKILPPSGHGSDYFDTFTEKTAQRT